jgi:valyl-tRNA synthetase
LWVLRKVLDDSLRLLHPYIPFVTEETWQQLKQAFVAADLGIEPDGGWPEALIIADWPEAGEAYPETAVFFEQFRELVRAIRAARAENNVEPAKFIAAQLSTGEKLAQYEALRPILVWLARLDDKALTIAEEVDAPEQAVTIALGEVTCYLPLAGMVDLAQEKERLTKELAGLNKEIARLSKLLASPFAEKAPPPVVQKERDKLAQYEAKKEEIETRLASL